MDELGVDGRGLVDGSPIDRTAETSRRYRSELGRRFDALARFNRVLARHVSDPVQAGLAPDAPIRSQVLVEKATTRLRLGANDEGDHTVVALAGATGVGKSSLFNALARMTLSPAGHLRPTTGHAHACVWNATGADALLDWLGVATERRFVRESVLDAEDEAPLRGLVLLDLPDVDSVATGNRIEAERLVGIVDLVIWVLDPQKYADQTVHDEYLRHMGALRDVTVVVFNQTDRLTPADAGRCRADLARLVEADGLPGVPVLGTSALSGEGIDEIRLLLEKTVAGRPAAMARLEGELDAIVREFAPLVSSDPVDEERVGREGVPELADGFAAAVGVRAVVAEAVGEYRARAAVPGLRARSSRVGSSDVAPADPAAVGLAVRRLAARTAANLPSPWPDQVRLAAGTELDRLPDELARAVEAARPRPPGMAGWWLARVLMALGILALLAGAGWLGWAAARGELDDLPSWFGLWLPAWVAGAGLAVAVLVPLVAAVVVRRRARKQRRVLEARFNEATLTVAREVVAPVRAVLRDYADARSALVAASD
jgi:energy-coupling factor transporter ATP-binding protein EcfA2